MALHSTAGVLTQTGVTTQVSAGSRITAIDALRGLALALMALTHAAFFIGVGMQAESYGGQRVYLQSPPYRISGLLTTLASPIFFCLAGVSLALLEQLIWLALRLIGGYGDLGECAAAEAQAVGQLP